MKINNKGLQLIKDFEGCRLKVYKDAVGFNTVGWGHLVLSEDNLQYNDIITQEKADELLKQDLEHFEKGISKLLKVQVTENQFAAIVSLAFNIGLQVFAKSSVLRYINTGYPVLAGQRILLFNKAGGKVLAGLTRRREAEKKMYETR
jgi:lysozyme